MSRAAAAVLGEGRLDRIDGLVGPSSKRAYQEYSETLKTIDPKTFAIEEARRSSKRPSDVNYMYCIVLPTEPKKPSRASTIMKCCTTPVEQTESEMMDSRHKILRAIKEAGFETELVYSTTRKQIFCKIGCNDERLLKEAELKEHPLELEPTSLQAVLELQIKDSLSDAEVDKPKHPIFLDYKNYNENYYMSVIQKSGGEDSLPLFLKRNFNEDNAREDMTPFTNARNSFLAQSRADPFKNIHFRYDSEWEKKIIREHRCQLYRTYRDDTIFRTADRIALCQYALEREVATRNGVRGAGLNLKKLAFKKDILAYYPIQYSQQTRKANDITSKQIFERFVVKFPCCNFGMFLPWRQPVQDLRNYCGEKIAYYFAFLEFYSFWLLISSFFGFVLFFVQLGALNRAFDTFDIVQSSAEVQSISAEGLNLTKRDGNFQDLFDFATPRTQFAVTLDPQDADKLILAIQTPTEIPSYIAAYAIFVSLWATFFLEFWKRHQASLAFKWGVSDYERTAEVRPAFKADYYVPDAVTGLPTPFRSSFTFAVKFSLSLSFVGFAIIVTIAAFVATYAFKVVASDLFDNATVGVQVALVVNAGVILILGTVFKTIARVLTDWENYRTDIEYEDQLIGKTFVFSFFNSYTTLVYFAFIKSGLNLIETQFCVTDLEPFESANASDVTGKVSRDDLVKIDSCYGSLGYSLFIIFASQIIVNNTMEVGIPMLKGFLKKYFNFRALRERAERAAERGVHLVQDNMDNVARLAKIDGFHARNEEKAAEPEEFDPSERTPLRSPIEGQFLLTPYNSPFQDYLELALQFGYVTLFVAAFPLAPTLALVNNFIEVWVDAKKVCILSRRPQLKSAQDIGTWLRVFEILSYIAIVTNSGVLVFTSKELVPLRKENDAIRVWAFLGFIVAIFTFKRFVDFFITDIPQRVVIMKKRQEYMQQKIFFDDEDLDENNVMKVSKENMKSTDEANAEIEADYNEFKVLDRDPYLDLILDEIYTKMKEKNLDAVKLFGTINTNNDSYINLKELKRALLRDDIGLGATMDTVTLDVFIEALDSNLDGKISQKELEDFIGRARGEEQV